LHKALSSKSANINVDLESSDQKLIKFSP